MASCRPARPGRTRSRLAAGAWARCMDAAMVTALPIRTLAGQAVTYPDTRRLARGGEHRRDPGADSPEVALESGRLRHLLPGGHLLVGIEPAEYAEHHTQMRVYPA